MRFIVMKYEVVYFSGKVEYLHSKDEVEELIDDLELGNRFDVSQIVDVSKSKIKTIWTDEEGLLVVL
jgi:SAM-dependent MidA family methyltransferase